MKQLINIFRCICLAEFVYHCQSSIKWNVINKSLKIGDKAELRCNGNDRSQNTRKTWYGGRSNDLLCYDNISTNQTKYEMKSSNYSFNSSLIIKKFNVSDVNCQYTCAFGFESHTHMLTLDDLDIVYDDLKDSSRLEDDRFIVEVEMKVYPIPKCSIFYKDTEYNLLVKIIKDVKSNGNGPELYTVTLKTLLDVGPIINYHNISVNVKCQAKSSKYYSILDINTNTCNDVKNEKSLKETFIWLGLSIVIAFIIIFLYAYIKRRQSRHKKQRYGKPGPQLS